MVTVTDVCAIEVFDSTGMPAIETRVTLSDGSVGVSCVASNLTDGQYAAANVTDIAMAVNKIQYTIKPKLIGLDALKQHELDVMLFELDGTKNKSKLGANTTLSVSMAVAKAGAKSAHQPLYIYLRQFIKQGGEPAKFPQVIFSFVNGGPEAENLLNFQDFFVVPGSFKSFHESLQIGARLHISLRSVLKKQNILPLFTARGGYMASLINNQAVFAMFEQILAGMNVRPGYDVFFGMDANANNFFAGGKYRIKDMSTTLTSKDLISYYSELVEKHHVLYIEDPLAEDDWEGWEKMTTEISHDTITVGDRLTGTNPYRLQMALGKKAISGIAIKPIQIGTIVEAMVVVEIARISGLKVIVTSQTGGGMDSFLADFAVAVGADYVNFGPLSRGENVINYNRLIQIDKELHK